VRYTTEAKNKTKFDSEHSRMEYSSLPEGAPVKVMTNEQGGQKVDPSVRLGPLRGEPNGAVPLERTMRKPMAYKEKAGPR
jgi:hypothetical protein